MLKRILLGLLGVVVLLVIIGFFLPGKMEITRSINMHAPAAYAFEEVNNLKRWNDWSYWNMQDSAMTQSFGEKTVGEGASYSWESDKMGKGKLTITESKPHEMIKADLDFMEQGTAKSWYAFSPAGDSTKVTMGFESELGMNPLARWMGTLMQGEIKKAFDESLVNIKQIAESKPVFKAPISEEEVAPVSYIGIKSTLNPQDNAAITAAMTKNYTELMKVLQQAKVQLAGHPFCLYPAFSETSMDMVCALPVPSGAKLPAKYAVATTPGGKAVKAVHTGAYEDLQQTHDEVNQYIKMKQLKEAGAPWEVYVTDPMVEKDTAKWVTEIYYPIKDI